MLYVVLWFIRIESDDNISNPFYVLEITFYHEIGHIFDRFYRVDKDRSRETGGTGLGLAITKEIINAHGGMIKVYSKINEGTTFSVRLPLAKPVKSGGKA